MHFLSITDPQNWLLAGISMVVVVAILVILVAILYIFSLVAKNQTTEKTKAVKSSTGQTKNLEKASEEDKAAVATALYLYFEEINNSESRVLTISPYNSAWGAQLNPRL